MVSKTLRLLQKFFKKSPKFLFDLIPSNGNSKQTRNSQNLAIVAWDNLDSDIRNSPSYSTFKKKILNFIRPRSNDVFNVSHPKGRIFLTRHLECKIKYSFLETLHPICICDFDTDTLNHIFFHCRR